MPARGFTLIELLVVMAIMAVAIGGMSVVLTGSSDTATLKASAQAVAEGLRRSRSRAITRNAEATFTLDVARHTYTLPNSPIRRRLPGDFDLKLVTARSERIDSGVAAIRFFPDGSSTGGRVSLTRNQREYRIDIDWLTGRVSIAQ